MYMHVGWQQEQENGGNVQHTHVDRHASSGMKMACRL